MDREAITGEKNIDKQRPKNNIQRSFKTSQNGNKISLKISVIYKPYLLQKRN